MNTLTKTFGLYLNKESLTPVGQVLGSQVLIKAIGFFLSIVLIRLLPKDDYATYTVLITIQGMMIPLSNSSIFIGFKKIGSEVWNDAEKMSKLIRTATQVSQYIIAIAFLLVGSYGGYILFKQGINSINIIFFLICLLLIVIAEVYTSFLRSAFLLQNKIGTTQLTELSGQVLRLIIISGFIVISKSNLTNNALLPIVVFSTWIPYFYIRFKSKELRSINPVVDNDYRHTIIKYIKLNWHNSAFFAFKAQISIFLMGILGSKDSLADLGALTRFGLIFTIVISLVQNIYAPAFGRCQNKEKLLLMYRNILLSIISASSVFLTIIYLFPESILWILGPNYQHLSTELFLVVLSGVINLLLSTVYTFNLFKGWIKYTPAWEIPLDILVISACTLVFDVTTLSGTLYMVITASVVNLCLHAANSFAGLSSIKDSQ